LGDGINGGVVPRSSPLYSRHTHLPDWPVDHAGEIGWGTDILFAILDIRHANAIPIDAREHFDRYDKVLTALLLGQFWLRVNTLAIALNTDCARHGTILFDRCLQCRQRLHFMPLESR
jgi:hypothetical protein